MYCACCLEIITQLSWCSNVTVKNLHTEQETTRYQQCFAHPLQLACLSLPACYCVLML